MRKRERKKKGRGTEKEEVKERGKEEAKERGKEEAKEREKEKKKEESEWSEVHELSYINSPCFQLHQQKSKGHEGVLSPLVQRYLVWMAQGMEVQNRTSPPHPNTVTHSRGQQETSPFFT